MIRLALGRAVAVWFVLVSWCASSQCHAAHREIIRHSDQGFHPSLHVGSTDGGRGLNLLVVGDWGRDGYYNQSQVAEKVRNQSELHLICLIVSLSSMNRVLNGPINRV
jgi:hypothetical protein